MSNESCAANNVIYYANNGFPFQGGFSEIDFYHKIEKKKFEEVFSNSKKHTSPFKVQ